MDINKNRWKVRNFPTILIYSHNSDICIYNTRVRVCFSWIVFPIESTVLTFEIGAHRTPSKRFAPWTRPIVVSNMYILFCCILVSVFIPHRECKYSDLTRYFQRFYALIFRQLSYILKYIVSGILGNDYGLYCRRKLYGCGGNYHIPLRLVHRLQFNRIENIWLDSAFQILCQDTNLLDKSTNLTDSLNWRVLSGGIQSQ